MKKHLWGSIFCGVLGFCVVICAFVLLWGRYDRITLEEKTVFGDRTKAEGVSLQFDSMWENRLFWTVSATVKQNGTDADTDFRFVGDGIDAAYYEEKPGPDLGNVQYGSGGITPAELKKFIGDKLYGVLEEISRDLPAGETKSYIVRLKDYYDYFPTNFLGVGDAVESVDRVDYFRIPVPSDYRHIFSISKDDNGKVISFDGQSSLSLQNYGFTDGDTVYAAFNLVQENRSAEQENVIESQTYMSLPADMRGIHCIPLKKGEGTADEKKTMPDFSRAKLGYGLAEDAVIISLTESTDGGSLYLVTAEDCNTYLTVIDKSSMKEVQKIDLHFTEGKDYDLGSFYDNLFPVIDCEKGLVVFFGDDFLCYEKGDDGKLSLWCKDRADGLESMYAYTENEAMDFDGTRLALGVRTFAETSITDDLGNTYSGIETTTSPGLLIYEKSGLVYAGIFQSSVEKDNTIDVQENKTPLRVRLP